MKKIIATFDGLKYADSTEKYALHLAKKYNVKLFGVFLEDLTYHSYKIIDMVGGDDVDLRKAEYLRRFDQENRENAIRLFHEHCEAEGVIYSTHRDRNIAIQELIHESLFADLVIIQNNETLTHYSEQTPTRFISGLLERSECPVLVVPPIFKNPEKVIFLYDGEPSSIFAIKQYAYLFPDENLHAELVTVNKKEQVIPDSHLLREWIKINYPDTSFHAITGDSHDEILRYLKNQVENTIVVMGAYGRGIISRMIHHSLADVLMSKLQVPLFIAHK